MGRTKDIEIDWNGAKQIVTLKALNYGEWNQLIEDCMDLKFSGTTTQAKLSQKNLRELSLVKCIVKAPFEVTIKNIQDLDQKTGVELFTAFEELNEQEPKKNS